MRNSLWRTASRWAVRGILLLLVGAVAFAIVILLVVPKATHGTAMNVLTGSMTPTIRQGSIIVDVPVDPGTLHVGDIATYQVAPDMGEYITHRIVEINTRTTPTSFIFKGDANRGPDMKAVPATAIRGKVLVHVRYLGAIRDLLHTKGGLTGTGLVLAALYALFQLVAGIRESRRGGDKHPATESAPQMLDAPATVFATLPLDSLARASVDAAYTLLECQLVEQTANGYRVTYTGESVQAIVDQLRNLAAEDIELALDTTSRQRSAVARLRGRASKTLTLASSDG
jgi:signal peptidase I